MPVGTPRGPYEVALRLSPMQSPSISRPGRMIAGMVTIGAKLEEAKLRDKVLPVGTPRGLYGVALRLTTMRSPSISRPGRVAAWGGHGAP